MKELKLFQKGEAQTHIPLYAEAIHAGFESPVADYEEGKVFFAQVIGECMVGSGIFPDDMLVVDRSLQPNSGDIVNSPLNRVLEQGAPGETKSMAIIEIDGFKVYSGQNGRNSIIINSDYIKECMEVYTRYELNGVAITTDHGYKLNNVDFLSDYRAIKHLSISTGIKDINAIHNLKGLESLTISGKNRKIDFSHFPFLEKLSVDWSRNFVNLEKCTQLKNLLLLTPLSI